MPPLTLRTRTLVFSLLVGMTALSRIAHAQWLPNGNRVAPSATDQTHMTATYDGSHGVYLGWIEAGHDVRVSRLIDSGALAAGWPAAGTLAIPSVDLYLPGANPPLLVPAGTNGVYVGSLGLKPLRTFLQPDGTVGPGWPDIDPPAQLGVPNPESPLIMGSDGGTGLLTMNSYANSVGNTIVSGVMIRHTAIDGTRSVDQLVQDLRIDGVFGSNGSFALGPDGAGGMVAVWAGWSQPYPNTTFLGTNVQCFHFPALPPFPASSSPTTIADPIRDVAEFTAVPDGAGGMVMAWHDARSAATSGEDIFAMRVDAAGTRKPGWSTDGTNACNAPGAQVAQAICADGAGGMWIAWVDRRSGGASDLYYTHLLANGTRAAGFPATGLALCTAAGDQLQPRLCPDGQGGMFATWQDLRAGNADIFVQRIDASGPRAFGWPDGGVAICTDPALQESPVVTAIGTKTAIVSWLDHRDGVAQVYSTITLQNGPVATEVALTSVDAQPGAVALAWTTSADATQRLVLERSRDGATWDALATLAPDGDGQLRFTDADVTPGERWAYRLQWSEAGATRTSAATWVVVPAAAFALRARGEAGALRFDVTLPGGDALDVRVHDVAGRLRGELRDAGAAGSRTLRLSGAGLEPGLYLVSARCGAARRSARVVLTR